MIMIQPCRVRKQYRCSCVPNKSDRRCARAACLGCGIHGLKPVGGSKRIEGPGSLVHWKTMTFATKKNVRWAREACLEAGMYLGETGLRFVLDGVRSPHGSLNAGPSFTLISVSWAW